MRRKTPLPLVPWQQLHTTLSQVGLVLAFSTPSYATDCGDYSDTPHWTHEINLPSEGKALAIQGDFASLGCGIFGNYEMRIVDISNPLAFTMRGVVSFGNSDPQNQPADVALSSSIAYVSLFSALKIINVADPDAPFVISTVPDWDATSIKVADSLCYLTGTSIGNLVILDISNPSAPTLLGVLDQLPPSLSIAVQGNYAYVGLGAGWLAAVDVSDPTSPQFISSEKVYDSSSNIVDVVLLDSYAFTAAGFGGIRMVDVSDPMDLHVAREIPTTGYAGRLSIADGRLFIAHHAQGLGVMDLKSLQEIPSIEFVDGGPAVVDLVVNGNFTHALTKEAPRLQLYDVSGSSFVSLIGQVDTPVLATDVGLDGHLAYVCDDSSGVQIIDILDPENPEIVSLVNTPGHAVDLVMSMPHVFVADQNKGLAVLDCSDPSAPVLIASVHTPGWATSIDLRGNYAYITHAWLGIYDISNPAAPFVMSILDQGAVNAYDVDVRDELAYMACGSSGFRIVDVSDPSSPYFIGATETPGDSRDVVVEGTFAYVADGLNGVQIIDVSNSSNPVIIATMDTPGFAHDLALSNNILYVADAESGIQVFDVAIPQSPIRLGNADTPGSCRGLTLSDDYVLVSDWTSGLVILPRNCETATSITESINRSSTRIHIAPNPLSNSGTHLSFEGLIRGNLDLALYDVSGRRLATLFHGPAADAPRRFFWDGNSPQGPIPPGVYFLKLDTGEEVRSEKLTVVR